MSEARPPRGTYTEDAAHRAVYSRAACIYVRRPSGVCYPRAAEDLAWAIGRCGELGMPLTMRGGGSGLAGQTVGVGMVADVSRWMNRVVSIDPDRRRAVVEPGVVLSDLNRALAPLGLRFSPDPSSQDFCTLGGMLANNAKGARSVKYGPTVDHVLALDMFLADGTEVSLERGFQRPEEYPSPALARAARFIADNREDILSRWPRTRANSSGYNLRACLGEDPQKVDLIPLFVGSEGTLASFHRATLHLLPLPGHQSLTMLGFADVASAGRAVIDLMALRPSACEILDDTFLQIIRRGLGTFPLPVEDSVHAILLVESDGETREEAEAAMDALLAAAATAGPVSVRRAATPAERSAIWSFRKAASPLLNKGRGKLKSLRFIEDGAVPLEAIPAYLQGVTEILNCRGIETVIFGHAGDGHFHVNPFMDLRDPVHFEQMPHIAREQSQLLADLGGTLSGEHGDGRLRTPFLPLVYGDLVELFRKIKLALDPRETPQPRDHRTRGGGAHGDGPALQPRLPPGPHPFAAGGGRVGLRGGALPRVRHLPRLLSYCPGQRPRPPLQPRPRPSAPGPARRGDRARRWRGGPRSGRSSSRVWAAPCAPSTAPRPWTSHRSQRPSGRPSRPASPGRGTPSSPGSPRWATAPAPGRGASSSRRATRPPPGR